MNKKQLESLKPIKVEIKSLTREIENWPEGIVSDFYYDYPNGQKRVRPLVGLADCSHLRRDLKAKLDELQQAVAEMEEYLDTVEDEEMRAILRLKYRNGLTLEQIGNELGYDKSAISRKLKAHWESCNKCNK